MGENKETKSSLPIFLLIIAIIIIVAMGFIIYKLNSEKNTEAQKTNSNAPSTTQSTQNTSESDDIKNDITKSDDTEYDITKVKNQYDEEVTAVITATKDGKTVTKEFEMDALIADTETAVYPTIGSVALVAYSGGEGYGVNFYQLVNDEIKKIGEIDCGADMVEEATYTVETEGEATAIITATRNGVETKKEFEMSAAIDKTEIIDVFDRGEIVLVAETGGEYYAFKAFRLSQDYTNGKTIDIVEVGTIQYMF